MMHFTFVKFICVGIINTCVGLSIMFLCFELFAWNYWMSTLTGNGVGAVISFFLNKNFTFQSNVPVIRGFLRFIFSLSICYLIAYKIGLDFTYLILDDITKFKNEIAIIVGSIFYSLLNYFFQRYIVFKKIPTKDVKG